MDRAGMDPVRIAVKRREGSLDLPLPKYATDGASGMDLYADVDSETTIMPGEIKLISSGIYISIPAGYEAEIRPRRGLALKHGISFVNSPGTIDSDYRGLVGLIMINHGKEPFVIKRGDRIAQMVIHEVTRAELVLTEDLDMTARQEGGFGHTGR